jgi:hypothetical protein
VEVLTDHQTIHFCTYDLETANCTARPGQCTRDEIIRLDRSNAVETDNLHREEWEALFRLGRDLQSPNGHRCLTASLHEQARRTITMK